MYRPRLIVAILCGSALVHGSESFAAKAGKRAGHTYVVTEDHFTEGEKLFKEGRLDRAAAKFRAWKELKRSDEERKVTAAFLDEHPEFKALPMFQAQGGDSR